MHARTFYLLISLSFAVLFLSPTPVAAGPYDSYLRCIEIDRTGPGRPAGPHETVNVLVRKELVCWQQSWPGYSPLPDEIVLPRGRGGSYNGNDVTEKSCSDLKKGRDSLKTQISQYSTMLNEINAALQSALDKHDQVIATIPPMRASSDSARQTCSARRTQVNDLRPQAIAHCARLAPRLRADCREAAMENPLMLTALEAQAVACTESRDKLGLLLETETLAHNLEINAISIGERRKDVYKDSLRLRNLLKNYNSEIKARCP